MKFSRLRIPTRNNANRKQCIAARAAKNENHGHDAVLKFRHDMLGLKRCLGPGVPDSCRYCRAWCGAFRGGSGFWPCLEISFGYGTACGSQLFNFWHL